MYFPISVYGLGVKEMDKGTHKLAGSIALSFLSSDLILFSNTFLSN